MGTIILVSVLSTVGVISVLMGVVIMFIKLRGKVDVMEMEQRMRDINLGIEERYRITNQRIDEMQRQLYMEVEQINKQMDSRCDKLDSKIKVMNLSRELK